MWNASADPFANTDPAKWRPYSLADNKMIERAFAQGQAQTMLNDYHIDFKELLQISKSDVNKQRPIKRFITDAPQQNREEGHFAMDLISPPARAHNGQYGWIPIFIKAAAKDLNLTRERLPSKDRMSIPKIVDSAVLGIIAESKALGEEAIKEGQEIGNELTARKNQTMKEVWECCARQYAKQTFLYKLVNETMRMIGRPGQEQLWQSKVRTLGPYSLLLWDNPSCVEPSKVKQELYRAINLTHEEFKSFGNNDEKGPKPEYSFQAFTSSSRNRAVAQDWPDTNAMLIMEVGMAFTVDLQSVSEYKEHEEVILPGVCFTVTRTEETTGMKKYHIYLKLNQRHRREYA